MIRLQHWRRLSHRSLWLSVKTRRRLLHLYHRLRSHRNLLRAKKKRRPTRLENCVDEDGAKKIEAIQETIIQVTTSSDPPTTAEAEQPTPPQPATKETPSAPPPLLEEVSIWGIPLLFDERSDIVLLKFLRARDFKVKEAFTMLKNVVAWRKEFGIESLLEEDRKHTKLSDEGFNFWRRVSGSSVSAQMEFAPSSKSTISRTLPGFSRESSVNP